MLTKLKAWNFKQTLERALEQKHRKKLLVCSCPFLFIFIKNELLSSLKESSAKVRKIFADDIKNAEGFNQIFGRGLFSSASCDLIFNIKDAPFKDYSGWENLWKDESREIWILSEGKSTWLSKLNHVKEFDIYELEEVKFWELGQFISYWGAKEQVSFDYTAIQFLSKELGEEFSFIFQLLDSLKKNNPQKKNFNLEDVRLGANQMGGRPSQFMLVELFSKKEFKNFYIRLLKANFSEVELRSFFKFFYGHLLKMRYSKTLSQKSQTNSYEKKIIQWALKWRPDEIDEELNKIYFLEKTLVFNPSQLKFWIEKMSLNYA